MKLLSLVLLGLACLGPSGEAMPLPIPLLGELRPASLPMARYFLELGGTPAGWVDAVEGGRAVADIVVERSGTDNVVRKHLGAIKVQDILLKVGVEMNPNFYAWIGDLLAARQAAKDGVLVEADPHQGTVSHRSFTSALLSDVTFPACDAGSKDPTKLGVSFAPGSIHFMFGGAGPPLPRFPGRRTKHLVADQFRLTIDGLDGAPVRHVDSFVVHQNTTTFRDGGTGLTRTIPTTVDYGNLRVVVRESGAQTWVAWMDATFQGGVPPQKEGMLEYLDTDLKTVLLRVKFHNLGLYSFGQFSIDGDDVEALEFGLFADSMEFEKP